MSTFQYYPDTDTLEIKIAGKPATGGAMNAGWDGEDDDILLNVDDQDRIVSITIERASVRADLDLIKNNDANVILGKSSESFTITSLAKELGVSRQAILVTIKKMGTAGYTVGKQYKPNDPIILSVADADAIRKWRVDHPRGRQPAISGA